MVQTAIGSNKILLNDIVVIRPLAIILLVAYHAFIIYTGGWKEPVRFQPIETYWWIGKATYAFMLELFVFISGYVFALSLRKKNLSLKQIVKNKIKRLIIPSVVFSIAYYLIFYNLDNLNIIASITDILSGCGHMWFLPMLFWTTLMCYIIDKVCIPPWIKIIGVLCLPVMSLLPIPLRIDVAMFYIPFFYVGMIVFRNRERIMAKYCNLNIINLWGGVFCIAFILGTLIIRDTVTPYMHQSLIVKLTAIIIQKYIVGIYAICGIAFTYLLINYILEIKRIKVSNIIISLNRSCFGIYLFQQFILQILYYKTNLPDFVGAYWLPWIGFAVALLSSYLLTRLLLMSKTGRYLV